MKQLFSGYEQLNLANKFYNQSNYEEAERICSEILANDSKNSDAYYILACCNYKKGKSNEALLLYKKCVGFNPLYVKAHCFIAAIYGEQNNTQESEKALKTALNDNNDNYVILYNLAANYQKQNKLKDALNLYNKIIKLGQASFDVYTNMAHCYQDLKDYDNAFRLYMTAKMQNPLSEIANNNLASLFFQKGELMKIIKFYDDLLKTNALDSYLFGRLTAQKLYYEVAEWSIFFDEYEGYELSSKTKAELIIARAIYSYVLEKYDLCKAYLQEFAVLDIKNEDKDRNYQSNLGFFEFLTNLMNEPKQAVESEDHIHIIGDSHVLSYSAIGLNLGGKNYKIVPHLIAGCKMWHLANNPINSYKRSFERSVRFLPKGSICIISIGEIDLRINEGIFKYLEGNSYEKTIKNTITGFCKFLSSLKQYGYNFIISGIPAPNNLKLLETLTPAQQEKYKYLIRDFNQRLKHQASKSKFAYLDYYAITSNEEHVSNKLYHLEEVHLKPIAMQHAVDKII